MNKRRQERKRYKGVNANATDDDDDDDELYDDDFD
jgi:hypothetical protein